MENDRKLSLQKSSYADKVKLTIGRPDMGNWYNVIKKVKGIDYAYKQTSWREGDKVKTKSIYLGRADKLTGYEYKPKNVITTKYDAKINTKIAYNKTMKILKPIIDILPPEQQKFWPLLSQIPERFTLYGGTALALRLGHRVSIDFDFFSTDKLDIEKLGHEIPFLKNAEIQDTDKDGMITYILNGVQFQFFGLSKSWKTIEDPEYVEENNIKIASITDILATKLKTIQQRISWKDYADIHIILTKTNISLAQGIAGALYLFDTKPSTFSPIDALKALGYYDGIDLKDLPITARENLIEHIGSIEFNEIKINLEQIKENAKTTS